MNGTMVTPELPLYLSGPNAMVNAFEDTLLKMDVRKGRIKTDFSPGFA